MFNDLLVIKTMSEHVIRNIETYQTQLEEYQRLSKLIEYHAGDLLQLSAELAQAHNKLDNCAFELNIALKVLQDYIAENYTYAR